jgi:cell division inhibitor SulA
MNSQTTDPVPTPNQIGTLVRRLKIEAVGDFWKGLVKPKIRLTGNWLARAGFPSGQTVQVICISPGVLELRSCATTPEAAPFSASAPTHSGG